MRTGTGRAFHKAESDIEKALDPVLVFIRGTTNLFEFVERRYLEHFGRTSKAARHAGWLSFRVRKVIAHILKWMRNLTGSQCNRFRIGTERLNRGALVTTLARRFWTRCNLAISFYGILWKVICNNLTFYWRVPLQFAWQDLGTGFFEFDACHGYDRSMRYMFGVCVFFKFRLLSNTTPIFLADADGFVSWPKIRHGKLCKNFSRWSLVPIRKHSAC